MGVRSDGQALRDTDETIVQTGDNPKKEQKGDLGLFI